MTVYYADSSVLVKRHANEKGSAWVRAMMDPTSGNDILTSHLSTIEVVRALYYKERVADAFGNKISVADRDQGVQDFLAVCTREYTLIQLTEPLLAHARDLIIHRMPAMPHLLKSSDTIHLASAHLANITLTTSLGGSLVFLASDGKLRANAAYLGIAVDDPEAH
jgi:uncharacterized protein